MKLSKLKDYKNTIVNGKFTCKEKIGAGSFGMIYKGITLYLNC